MFCKKKKNINEPLEKSAYDEVIGNEDLAFQISSYIYPTRNPFRLLDLCNNLCFVSSTWNQSFSLVRAQLRWDYLTQHIEQEEDKDIVYHKLSYFPGGTREEEEGNQVSFPREGCLRIYQSNCNRACDDATKEYRRNIQNDQYSDRRVDSRPDYYYRAHRESPECIEFVLPRPLLWDSPIHYVNEIVFDDKPRLVNKFTGRIGDINGVSSPLAGKEKSQEGMWNLGYHEIRSVRDMATCSAHHRPPLNGYGADTTSFLRACSARPSDDPRWLKFCHLIGEDRCRLFLKKSLLPMIGPRPTGASEVYR